MSLFRVKKPKTLIALSCANCGASFMRWRSEAAKATTHYCGAQCQRASRAGDKNPNFRGGPKSYICAQCATPFSRYGECRSSKPTKYCSVVCRIAASRIYVSARAAARAGERRREARERATRKDIGYHTELEWQAILREHNHSCAYCQNTENIERDHIIPLSKGGTEMADNIQPLCRTCNRKKHAKLGYFPLQLELIP